MEEVKINDQFKATKLWNALVDYVRSNISTRKYRHRLKSYDDSFTGMEVVDIVYKFITEDGLEYTKNKKFERLQAVKVGQFLMDRKIFRSSGTGKNVESVAFEDSHRKFYQFIDVSKCDSSSMTNTSLENALESLSPRTRFYDSPTKIIQNPYNDENSFGSSSFTKSFRSSTRKPKGRPMMKKLMSLTSLVKSNNANCNKSYDGPECIEESATCVNIIRTPSVGSMKRSWTVASLDENDEISSQKKKQATELSPILSEVVWKKLALARLLALIEVPYLEDILLLFDDDTISKELTDTTFSNPSYLYKRLAYDDRWLSAAQAVVDKSLSHCKPRNCSKEDWKKSAFKVVVDYCSQFKFPLIPNALQDIFVNIFKLLKEDKFKTAALVTQLVIILLPWYRKNKLELLIGFINVVSNDRSLQLNPKISNEVEAASKLSSVILNFPLLGHEQRCSLVCFLSQNCDVIFTPPVELRREVDKILKSANDYEFDTGSGLHFCKQISTDLYETEKTSNTETALSQLLETKLKDLKISTRDKSKWLYKFHKSHPAIYAKYFKKDDC